MAAAADGGSLTGIDNLLESHSRLFPTLAKLNGINRIMFGCGPAKIPAAAENLVTGVLFVDNRRHDLADALKSNELEMWSCRPNGFSRSSRPPLVRAHPFRYDGPCSAKPFL